MVHPKDARRRVLTTATPSAASCVRRRGAAAAIAVTLLASAGLATNAVSAPLTIEKQGAFAVGGKVVGDAEKSLHCDHGVVEFQIPPHARAVNLLMWHSASAGAWQNRWDGGEGFETLFVRRGFPVYIWDGPRVGRANRGCAETTYKPAIGQDQQNFVAWRLGSQYPEWFDGVQFPKNDPEAWNQATRARYQEFDTVANAQLESDAAAELANRIGPTVALTSSAGGMRALLAALKSDNIKGIVAYENVGYVFPQGEGPGGAQGPFGPIEVPLDEFRRLTKIPMQMVWGDNVDKSANFSAALVLSKRFVEIVNKYGGHAEILMLRDAGLTGNTHLPFADLNNVAVADLLSKYLHAHGLDPRSR